MTGPMEVLRYINEQLTFGPLPDMTVRNEGIIYIIRELQYQTVPEGPSVPEAPAQPRFFQRGSIALREAPRYNQ